MRAEILDQLGNVINTIVAGQAFLDANYPGMWREVAEAPPVAVEVTAIERSALLGRMTPQELHAWRRAGQRALGTDAPVIADRNALYAWLRWESLEQTVDLTSSDIRGLKSVWMALGMSDARAEELLAPLSA